MKYLRCRNSILILYRDWSDSKDVLDLLDNLCQIHGGEARKEETKGQTDSGKRPTSKLESASSWFLSRLLETAGWFVGKC